MTSIPRWLETVLCGALVIPLLIILIRFIITDIIPMGISVGTDISRWFDSLLGNDFLWYEVLLVRFVFTVMLFAILIKGSIRIYRTYILDETSTLESTAIEK